MHLFTTVINTIHIDRSSGIQTYKSYMIMIVSVTNTPQSHISTLSDLTLASKTPRERVFLNFPDLFTHMFCVLFVTFYDDPEPIPTPLVVGVTEWLAKIYNIAHRRHLGTSLEPKTMKLSAETHKSRLFEPKIKWRWKPEVGSSNLLCGLNHSAIDKRFENLAYTIFFFF